MRYRCYQIRLLKAHRFYKEEFFYGKPLKWFGKLPFVEISYYMD